MSQSVVEAPTAARTILVAPLSGTLLPIEEVPDPVFAEKMVGDGVSIDPVSQILLAPCAGEVIQLHPSHHAVTVRTAEGLEVLMHIGLDTVTLRGEGFTPKVKEGDRVRTGDPLIAFDADYIALHAVSLLTQIVITNGDRVSGYFPKTGAVSAVRDVVLELELRGGTPAAAPEAEGEILTSGDIIVPNPTGLHARPAAVLANLAKKYQSKIYLRRGSERANAKSVVALMGMQVNRGDTVCLEAMGEDAEVAIANLTTAIREGLGEEGATPIAVPPSLSQPEAAKPAPRPRSEDPNILLGVAASPGVAVGYLHQVKTQEMEVEEAGSEPHAERRRLEAAIAQAQLEVESLRAKVHGQGDPQKAAIFAAHQEILDDPELFDMAGSAIDKGKSAAFAWKQTYTTQAAQLARLDNPLLAERANDVRDVGDRVLRILAGVTAETVAYPENTILAAEDLTPSDMANLDRTRIVGFATVAGGATSHVAILARSMDIPAIAGTEERVLDLENGTPVILDGSKGRLRLHPSQEEMERTRDRLQRLATKREADFAAKDEPAITTDGYRIEVAANIGNLEEAQKTVALGGEGVGLLRTELIFMERPSAPDQDTQARIYSDIAAALEGRSLIIRTLDVGGDKPLPYLPMPREENPFLGERGIRLGFDRPELLRTQLRAVLQASQHGKIRVMFPMIARLEELRMAKAVLEEERQNLGLPPIEIGIMIEIPSAAVMADLFAREVDFFSIGTNDLTQYTLAMDRGHPKLAPLIDGLDPGVLRLIDLTVRGASRHGKWVGVCGGMGSDPQAVPILLGLGITELSVSIPSIPSIKAQIRRISMAECQELAQRAIAAETAAQVRDLSPLPEE